jgi:lactoylglutathione lyase
LAPIINAFSLARRDAGTPHKTKSVWPIQRQKLRRSCDFVDRHGGGHCGTLPVLLRQCPFQPKEDTLKYLHTMVRVTNVEESLRFYCEGLGLEEVRRTENEKGRFTLIFLSAPGDTGGEVELTYNWDPEEYSGGRNFGHLAYRVKDIYALCQHLSDMGVVINRPPRDGHMAFVRSPDGISVELIQDGRLDPQEPWASMPNTGVW